MPRGEASLGPLAVAWEVPDAFPDAAGGLQYLAERGGTRATWSVREGQPGAAPSRFDAFYGPVKVDFTHPSGVRVWSPGAELLVREGCVEGVASGHTALPATIALHALAAHAGLAHLHAALVSIDGWNVLAPGGSGAGKTSFALAIGRHGGELLSDDLVYVDGELVAWPVRRPAHVTSTTLAAHAELSVLGPVVEGVLEKVRVQLPIRGPAALVLVDAILVPSLDPVGPTRVTPIHGVDAFPVLVGSSALAVVEGSPRREAILDLLATLAERPAARLVAGRDALEDPSVISTEVRRWLATLR